MMHATISIMRTVQPVIDRHCISCHGLEKTEKVNLVHDGQTYPQSYKALVALGDHRIGLKGYKTEENTISRPFEYFAHGSKLPGMLLADHGDVQVDRDGWAPDLKSGAGEGWIVKARENFRQRVRE